MTYLSSQFEKNNLSRENFLSRITFRAFDIIVSFGALILFSPLMLGIAIFIKTTSKGSILFKQSRYGLDQKIFTIYKFRTMTISASQKEFKQAVKNDTRVTFAGKFLRKVSLDELPQIFNVLTGSMSIVGPRPHPTDMDDRYIKIISNYSKRFETKPGITGLAQIKGFRGPTDTIEKITNRINADCEYVLKKSVFSDLKIILLTLPALVRPQNAF